MKPGNRGNMEGDPSASPDSAPPSALRQLYETRPSPDESRDSTSTYPPFRDPFRRRAFPAAASQHNTPTTPPLRNYLGDFRTLQLTEALQLDSYFRNRSPSPTESSTDKNENDFTITHRGRSAYKPAMEPIRTAHTALETKSNLSKAIADVQTLIDQLQRTRDAVADAPELAPLHLAKLKQPVKVAFEKIEDDLKDVNKGLNQYQKALKDKFKAAQLPTADGSALGKGEERALVDRAIAMHLLREGKFGVAGTFVREVRDMQRRGLAQMGKDGKGEELEPEAQQYYDAWLDDFSTTKMDEDDDEDMGTNEAGKPQPALQAKFTEMYHVLTSLRHHHDLNPAIAWARAHSTALEQRGSNLEFELARLKFVELYNASPSPSNDEDAFAASLRALQYARETFPAFSPRYAHESAQLLGSLAYSSGLDQSPYHRFFPTSSTSATTSTDNYTTVATSFTREFCGMLGLSSSSPLYLAVTAGGISLPILEKVERVMAASRGQWTSVNELPVETPLPREMQFHSIFVCPVSKEQATDANPPMLLPCGHVIAKESLEMHARGKSRMKCPYCPLECAPREARRVYI